MIEWWTYTLGDFLMFAPRTYWRLVELHNAASWPAPVTLPLAGAVAAWALWRGRGVPVVCVLFGCLWAWVGWAFHAQRYAAINWAAEGFAVAFFAEAVLWLVAALVAWQVPPANAERTNVLARSIGLAMWLVALAGFPLLAPLAGRPWSQAEVFGVMPDPTVLATLGGLLMASDGPLPRAWRVGLAVVPLAWCAIGGATLLAMHEGTWPVLPVAGALWLGLAWNRWRARRRAS